MIGSGTSDTGTAEHRVKLLAAEPENKITGAFSALVSDFQHDREGERFDRHAFDGAVAKLRTDGRPIPILFGHDQGSMSSIVGFVPPDGVEIRPEGLVAHGHLDVNVNDVSAKVFEMLERDVLKWSIGFTVKESRPEPGGRRTITEVGELLEVSTVPVPANANTRTLLLKGTVVNGDPEPLDEATLRAWTREALGDDDHVRAQARADMLALFDPQTKATQREMDPQTPREPVRIATFEA